MEKCCIVTPASATPFAPITTTTTSSTPIKTKKKKSNVTAIVVPVVLVSIVLGVLLIVGWLHFGNPLNLTKKNPRAADNSSNKHPTISFKKRPPIIEPVPDVVSC